VPTLERGTFDVILNGLEITPARARQVAFSRPYYLFAERLVVRSGERRSTSLRDLRGVRVGTLANSLSWDLLGDVGAERVPFEGVEEPFLDLLAGRTDAVLLDDIICDRYGKKPGLVVAGDIGQGAYAVGLRLGDHALRAAIDAALYQLIGSGELRAILRRAGIDGPRQANLPPSAEALLATMGTAPVGGPSLRPAPVMTPPSAGESPRGRRLSSHQVALFLRGALVTLLISAAAMLIAMGGGLALAAARLPGRTFARRSLSAAATLYVEVVRGTPVLLQLYVIYFGLAPVLALPPLVAAILGLGLNYAAYEAENYRAGIQAVPRGQVEAAECLGMPGPLIFRRVVLPQALRFSLPGVANDFIALLKDSSLVSVITVVELTKRMTIVAVDITSWVIPGALTAGLYLAMSYPLSRLARRLERRLAPGGAA
jgi:polar amino acid transport system substrate-binding protein